MTGGRAGRLCNREICLLGADVLGREWKATSWRPLMRGCHGPGAIEDPVHVRMHLARKPGDVGCVPPGQRAQNSNPAAKTPRTPRNGPRILTVHTLAILASWRPKCSFLPQIRSVTARRPLFRVDHVGHTQKERGQEVRPPVGPGLAVARHVCGVYPNQECYASRTCTPIQSPLGVEQRNDDLGKTVDVVERVAGSDRLQRLLVWQREDAARRTPWSGHRALGVFRSGGRRNSLDRRRRWVVSGEQPTID